MKKNVGSIDKILRLVIAAAAGYFAYTGGLEETLSYVALYAVTGIMLLTAAVGTCPIYSILGMKTNK